MEAELSTSSAFAALTAKVYVLPVDRFVTSQVGLGIVYEDFVAVHVLEVPPSLLVAVTVYFASQVVSTGAVQVTSAAPVVPPVETETLDGASTAAGVK